LAARRRKAAANEGAISGISAAALVEAIRAAGHKNVIYCSTLQESIEFLLREARPGDAVLTIGAGNITRALGELALLLTAQQSDTTHVAGKRDPICD